MAKTNSTVAFTLVHQVQFFVHFYNYSFIQKLFIPETFSCGNNGRCIPLAWKCDHQNDCPNGEDEVGCNKTCPMGKFQCKYGLECISVEWVCDGEADCGDERDCRGRTPPFVLPIVPTTPKPTNGAGGVNESELDRGLFEACTSDEYACYTGECLPYSKVCDIQLDCKDGSDEGPGN